LKVFFEAMFNYCFPIDYREKQREKLEQTFQDNKTVSEYSYEMEEICNKIGLVDGREKVSRFWHGLRNLIQAALWRDRYNAVTSSWDEVKEAAQIIEIAEDVGRDSDSAHDEFSDSRSIPIVRVMIVILKLRMTRRNLKTGKGPRCILD